MTCDKLDQIIINICTQYFIGVLSARWRLLQGPIIGKTCNVVKMVKAMCVLHNIVKTREPARYAPPGFVDSDDQDNGQWRTEGTRMANMEHQRARNSAVNSADMRDAFCNYFNSNIGRLDWQDDYITRLV